VGTGVPAVVGTNGDAQASAVAETIMGGGGCSCVPVAAELGCDSLPFLHFRLLEDSRSCSRKLIDTYEVGPKVGEGTYGVVLSGKRRGTDQPLAIKRLKAVADGDVRVASQGGVTRGMHVAAFWQAQ
jgi:hypothetical protein